MSILAYRIFLSLSGHCRFAVNTSRYFLAFLAFLCLDEDEESGLPRLATGFLLLTFIIASSSSEPEIDKELTSGYSAMMWGLWAFYEGAKFGFMFVLKYHSLSAILFHHL